MGTSAAAADGGLHPSEWPEEAVARAEAALRPAADPARAEAMAAYMKHVAPFLGIGAPERRGLLRAAWRDLRPPTSDDLAGAAHALSALPERELHYAAADLLARWVRVPDAGFLAEHVEALLTTTPWWDTVDALGTAIVTPLCARFDERPTIRRWSSSRDQWLIRAAIQHQRGRGDGTDVELVLELCAQHSHDTRFFVAKAIGWALRDLARLRPGVVRAFLRQHPELGRVAVREAERGLATPRRALP